ncbi:MAG TPA: anti-sigma factor [Candidatus Acidoferrales bacterium]|nr:anti-sigma factor [Candidatus Acidoferrales bacterium]
MSWSCVQVEERLSDYLDNALTEAERLEFRAHVDSCAHCAPLLAQVSHITESLRGLELEPAPPMLVSRILDQTIAPRKAKRQWFSWIPIIWNPRFATGAVTVLATLLIIFHAAGVKPSQLTAADFNPVNIIHSADRHAHLAFARSVKFVNDLRVVYEIQSRLQPGANPPNQQAPSETPSQQQPKPPRQSQRSFGTDRYSVAASFFATALDRSNP